MNIFQFIHKIEQLRTEHVQRMIEIGATSWEDYRAQRATLQTFDKVLDAAREGDEKQREDKAA